MFCKQTYLQGLIQKSKEKNINKNINPYIKEQTMSDGELRLRRRVSHIQKLLDKPTNELLCADLHRWNMLQRHESNIDVATCLDNLFGTPNLYADSHRWMQRCMVLNNSRTDPPDYNIETGMPIPGPSCHYDQLGGFEGMLQKLWTPSTICIIKVTAAEANIDIEMLEQGDNISLVIKWKSFQYQDRDRLRNEFLENLGRNFQRMGLRLKKEETWFSTSLFEYGKVRWYNGCPISSGTKRALRIIPDEHDGIPTTDTGFSIIATATENIALQDWCPDPAFILYGILVLSYMFRKEILLRTTEVDMLVAVLNWPNILGGINISNFPNHNIRGIDDKLTLWNSIILNLSRLNNAAFLLLSKLVDMKPRQKISKESLVKDPYSLNIGIIRTPVLTLKEVMQEFIPSYTTNPEVSDILNLAQKEKTQLIDALFTLKPYFGGLAHEIYRDSNCGNAEHLRNRLTNIQSISKVSRTQSEIDVYEITENENLKYNKLLKEKIKKAQIDGKRSCPFFFKFYNRPTRVCSLELSLEMRRFYWKKDIVGISKPVPWEQFLVTNYDKIHPDNLKYTIVTTVSDELRCDRDYLYNIGPFSVYIGSVTHVKSIRSKIQYRDTTPCILAFRQLLYLRSWAVKMNFKSGISLIDILLYSKSKLIEDENLIKLLIEENDQIYSGNPFHRFKMLEDSGGALVNYLVSISSHVKSSTINMAELSQDGTDYNLFFQLIFLWIQTIISDKVLYFGGELLPGQFGTVLKCTNCLKVYEEQQFELSIKKLSKLASKLKSPVTFPIGQTFQGGLTRILTFDPYDNTKFSLAYLASLNITDQTAKYLLTSEQDRTCEMELEDSLAFSSVNLNEFRSIPCRVLICLLLVTNRYIRKDILSSLFYNRTSFNPETYLPLAILLTFSHTQNQFFLSLGYRPKNFSECTTATNLAKILPTYLLPYIINHFEAIITLILSLEIPEMQVTENIHFMRWWLSVQIYRIKEQIQLSIVANPNMLKTDKRLKFRDIRTLRHLGRSSKEVTFDFSNFLIYFYRELRNNNIKFNIPHIRSPNINCPSIDACQLIWRNGGCTRFAEENLLPNKGKIDVINIMNLDTIKYNLQYSSTEEFFQSVIPEYLLAQMGYEVYSKDKVMVTNLPPKMQTIVKTLKSISRPVGHCNKSCNTIIVFVKELVERLDWNVDNKAIICLADGSCTTSLVMQHMFPEAVVYPNTLLSPSSFKATDHAKVLPPAYLGDPCPLIQQRLTQASSSLLLNGLTDITDLKFLDKMNSVIKQEIGFILIDLEASDPSTYIALCNMLPHYFKYMTSNKNTLAFILVRMLFIKETIARLTIFLEDICHLVIKFVTDDQCDNIGHLLLILPNDDIARIIPLEQLSNGNITTMNQIQTQYAGRHILLVNQICCDYKGGLHCGEFIDQLDEMRTRILSLDTTLHLECMIPSNSVIKKKHGSLQMCLYMTEVLKNCISTTWEHLEKENYSQATLVKKYGRLSYLTSYIELIIIVLSLKFCLENKGSSWKKFIWDWLVFLDKYTISIITLKTNRQNTVFTKLEIKLEKSVDQYDTILGHNSKFVKEIISVCYNGNDVCTKGCSCIKKPRARVFSHIGDKQETQFRPQGKRLNIVGNELEISIYNVFQSLASAFNTVSKYILTK